MVEGGAAAQAARRGRARVGHISCRSIRPGRARPARCSASTPWPTPPARRTDGAVRETHENWRFDCTWRCPLRPAHVPAAHARRRCYRGGPSAAGVRMERCEAALGARLAFSSLSATTAMHIRAHDSTFRAGDQHRRQRAARARREAQLEILSDERRCSRAGVIGMAGPVLRARREGARGAELSHRGDGGSKSTRGIVHGSTKPR